MFEQIAEIVGTLVGIMYLYWEFRADSKVWIAGMIMPAISLLVYWNAGLYADFGINVYYLLAAIYGLVAWKRCVSKDGVVSCELPITFTPKGMILPLMVVFLFSYILIAYILLHYTNSNVPWWDAFTTALSIVGMWMLSRKWLEQWLTWIVVDAVSAGLYIYKGIYFYAALYAVYTIVAYLGYLEWKKKM